MDRDKRKTKKGDGRWVWGRKEEVGGSEDKEWRGDLQRETQLLRILQLGQFTLPQPELPLPHRANHELRAGE